MSRLVGFLVIGTTVGALCYFGSGAVQQDQKHEKNVVCDAPGNQATLVRFPASGKYYVYRDVWPEVTMLPSRYRRYYHPPVVSGAQLVDQKTSQLITVKPAVLVAGPGRAKLGEIYISNPGLYSIKGTPNNARGSIVITRD